MLLSRDVGGKRINLRIRDTHRFRRHPSLPLVPTHFLSSSLSSTSGNKTKSNPFNGGKEEHILRGLTGAAGIGVALFCATTSAECERSSDEKALDDDADDEWFLLKRAKEFVSQLTGGANTLEEFRSYRTNTGGRYFSRTRIACENTRTWTKCSRISRPVRTREGKR